MIPDPQTVAANINDALAAQNPLLDALDAAQRAAQEAKEQVRAITEAVKDLEDQAATEALEDPKATNEPKRKAAAAAWLRDHCPPYKAAKEQLADAQRALREAEANRDDCERRLKSADKSLVALVALAEMTCHAEARQTAQIKLEGQRLYMRGCQDYKAAADTQLAARGGAR